MKLPSVLELFQIKATTHRDKCAILTEGRTAVTYGELQNKAWRVAQSLIVSGVKPGTIVGIAISKSSDYIAAMLGVWLAGGAFVPVDPILPEERRKFIIKQSGIYSLLIKQASDHLFADCGIPLVRVDDDWSNNSIDRTALDGAVSYAVPEERLAYLIYTSGSTGRPKGVMVPHRGITNFIQAQIEAFQLTTESNVLFFLSTNFDASISDIGTALLAGATICIEPAGKLCPGPDFYRLLAERKITHLDVPPAVLRSLNVAQLPASLETIIIGGEPCAPDVVRTWAKRCRVVNVYGPTEATVCTSLCICDAERWDRPLIGKPIPNVTYYLLDENLSPAELGTPAQLYIGGISLADGYVNEPELTASKFLTVEGQRLYRTGDLVIECDDGEFQFLGRIDRQFKLRGMLIEPEEIESKIAQHAEVEGVAVLKRLLRADLPGDKLVAFVCLRPGSKITVEALKKQLSESLPSWMVPQLIELVQQLPTTATGKVDLTALRVAPLTVCSPSTAECETTSAAQHALVEVWKQVLGLPSVGLEDDFFALGGDSLNVLEAVVAAHLRGLSIAPDLFASHPTISALSTALEERKRVGGGTEIAYSGAMNRQMLWEDVLTESALQSSNATGYEQTKTPLASGPQRLFLTGATGFLGSRLLSEFLKNTGVEVHCLVRASDDATALERIRQALALHGISLKVNDAQRIVPVIGELGKARFGLDNRRWSKLAAEIDTIFHCAATVNMLKSYWELRSTNLKGTREIARLKGEGRAKSLHYASTLSVFVATDRNTGIAEESDRLESPASVYGGYAQTKFAAELLLRSLEAQIGEVSYYRFGLLTGDSHSGKSSPDDFLCLFARGIAQLGCIPVSLEEIMVDITPVDFAAAAMTHIAWADSTEGKANTYHIANEKSLSLSALVTAMNSVGLRVERLTTNQFLARVKQKGDRLTSFESAACLALCRTLGEQESFTNFRCMDLFQATNIRFDCQNTQKHLKDSRIICPPPSQALIESYLRQSLLQFC